MGLMAFSPLSAYTGAFPIFTDKTVTAIATKHGKSNAQVALRWLLQQKIPLVTRSDNEKHVIGDLDAFDFELDSDDMTTLSALAPPTCLTEKDPDQVPEGDRDSCQTAMYWAKNAGVVQHPDWYPG